MNHWKRFLLSLCVAMITICNMAYAQTVIECTVNYAYADKKKAIREQIWEEDWVWDVQSDAGFQVAKKTATSVRIQSSQELPSGSCIITLKNKFGQLHQLQLNMSELKADKNGRISTSLTKTYNKIILKNKAGIEVSGNIYFGPSGSDASMLDNSSEHIKCPPAAGGGYSFPSIFQKTNTDYSVYMFDTNGNCTEISFSEKRWYGQKIIESVKIN